MPCEFEMHDMEVDDDHFVMCKCPEDAVRDAHAIVVLTEWDCFKDYDYSSFFASMQKPAFLFDGRNMLDHAGLEQIGFEVHALGKAISPQPATSRRCIEPSQLVSGGVAGAKS